LETFVEFFFLFFKLSGDRDSGEEKYEYEYFQGEEKKGLG